MVSGLYQSSALKFFIGQFRQGRDRHRQAVLKARNAAVSGAVLGAALASIPVYAVVRASRRVGQNLRRSLATSFSGIKIEAKNLLSFADFEGTLIDLSSLTESYLGTQSVSNVEAPIMKTLLAVGTCLSPKQVLQLHWMGSTQRLRGWLSRQGIAQQGKNHLAVTQTAVQITGVASDLATRSLVLVRGYITIWSELSVAQQSQLQTKITLWLTREQTASQTLPTATAVMTATAKAASAIDGVKALTHSYFLLRPLSFFWVEVLRIMSQWQRSHKNKAYARLKRNFAQLAAISMPSQSALNRNALSQQKIVGSTQPKRTKRALPKMRATLKDCVEASAVAVGYVEHPLEIVLKWVDRCLLWVEERWRSLKQWLTHKPI